jgi:hypothetical protein
MNIDLSKIPAPTRHLDGVTAPMSVEAHSHHPGVVRLVVTADTYRAARRRVDEAKQKVNQIRAILDRAIDGPGDA